MNKCSAPFSLFLLCLSLQAEHIGPWNLDTLFEVPEWRNTDKAARKGVMGILYESIPYEGKRVQVFAYYGVPAGDPPAGGWPAVVCVHGGGGTAFDAWVAKWNERGYAAISMDLEGHYPINKTERREDGRVPTEHPGPSRAGIFDDFEKPVDEQWYYHAVAQAIRAHSLIRSFPEVNSEKIGLTGISWGGTLTSTIMGVDSRFQFAIPVYGCGFLPDSDSRQGKAIKPGEHTEVVNRYFDGSAYFSNVRIPTFWLNGTNDGAFALPSNQRSSQAVRGPVTLRYELRMQHGHRPGWEPEEIYAFADSVIKEGKSLPQLGEPTISESGVSVVYDAAADVVEANLLYTTETGVWNERLWQSAKATVSDSILSAQLPDDAVAFFFNATDERGLMVSSEYIVVP